MSDKIVEIYKKGDTGQSAYEAAVEAGFIGTKAQWVASVEAARLDAEQSASEASTSASNALASEQNAKSSEDAALLSKNAAKTSETNSAVSESNALSYKNSAYDDAVSALSSRNAAKSSEDAALISKNAAKASEDNAKTSETNSGNSASTATTKAGEALSSANAASQSKIDAQAIATAQGKKYLGDKSSDPGLDNEGAALVAGTLYFNTTTQMIRRWSGSAWVNNFNPTVQQATGPSTTDVMSQKAATDTFTQKQIVIGKNKFNVSDTDISLAHYVNYTNGNLDSSASYNTSGWIPVIAGANYVGNKLVHLAWYNSSKTYISGGSAVSAGTVLTAPTGAAYIRVSPAVSNWAAFQFEAGSTVTAWEAYSAVVTLESIALPSHSQPQSSIVGLVDDLSAKAALVDAPGKNRFNPSDADVSMGHYISYVNGVLGVSASYNATGFIPVSAGVTYYLSYKYYIAWYNSSKTFISGDNATSDASKVQTAPANAAYLRCSVATVYWSTFQVEIGSLPTAYEAYVSHKEVNNAYIQAARIFGLQAYLLPENVGTIGYLNRNRIALPVKQYFLGNYENTIYHQAICERWLPNQFCLQIENGGFQNRQRFSRITNPSADGSVDAKLYDLDFMAQSSKNFALLVGAQATNNGALVLNVIGDSLTYNGSYILRARQLSPSLTFSGMRVPYGDSGVTVEGRGGWKLSDYFSQLHQTTDSFSPFLHLADPYKYYGNTDFWKKVVTGNVTYAYAGFSTLATAIGFSASTGLKSSPVTNDVMYNDANVRYEKWDGSAWVAFTAVAGDFSFNYAKYRSVWGITQPNIVTVLLGYNDFMTTAISDIPAAFVTWKANMESMITSIHADSPNSKIALLIPHSAVGGGNDGIDYDYPAMKYNAAMWNFRKLLIDNFDQREAEKIYIVDAGSAVDPIYGIAFNTAEKPFSDYAGTETVKLQSNNPHPSTEGYYQMGVRLAGFIQAIR